MKHFLKNGIVIALGLAALSTSAFAENQIQTLAVTPAESGVTVGIGAYIVPEYAGARKDRFVLTPSISYHNSNGLYAGTNEGVGYNAKIDNFSLSAGLGYRAGRTDSNDGWKFRYGSDDLKGMGDISGALTARFKGAYKFDGGISLSLGTEQALNHRDTGSTYHFGLNAPLFDSKTDQFSLSLGATYGDRKFNQSNFGVTSAQSLNSGYKAYNAKAGFEQLGSTVNWTHALDKNWSVTTRVGVTHVLGDAADSPIVKKKTSGVAMTAFNYSF